MNITIDTKLTMECVCGNKEEQDIKNNRYDVFKMFSVYINQERRKYDIQVECLVCNNATRKKF